MPYRSSLTDKEWETLEPLLIQILPTKKQTRPPNWTKREILDGILYQLKNGCSWEDLPKDLPPYSTVYWHYKQWRKSGVFEELMSVLHCGVRESLPPNHDENQVSTLHEALETREGCARKIWLCSGCGSVGN